MTFGGLFLLAGWQANLISSLSSQRVLSILISAGKRMISRNTSNCFGEIRNGNGGLVSGMCGAITRDGVVGKNIDIVILVCTDVPDII